MADTDVHKRFPTIFGQARDNRNVVIAVDTSGSMYNKLDSVKTHLIEFLLELALHKNVNFNLLEFNSEIRCWSDKMVVCSQSTVEVAIPWIKTLSPKTGTNTLDALLAAFDNDCDSVYLVTDGLPDQHPFDILDEVVYASNQRPVHCVYLTGDTSDAAAVRFLERLAAETHGSFLMASITRYGCMEKMTPVYQANHAHERSVRSTQGTLHPTVTKHCSVTTSLSGDPILPLYPAFVSGFGGGPAVWPYVYEPYWWTRYHTAKTFMRSATKIGDQLVYSNMGVAPSAGLLLIGQKVVARRQEDGYYYPGTVTSQINNEVFLVEFAGRQVGDYEDIKYQETALYDIISHTDALRHPVIPGDKVLAQAEDGKYAPGVVIAGMENRGADNGALDKPVTVSLHDGRTRDPAPNSAIWIPGQLYDRITLEIKVPENARKPMTAVEGYPTKTLPGYPSSGPYSYPQQYSKFYPSLVDCGDTLLDCTWFGYPKFVGIHSAMYKPKDAPPVSFKSTEIEAKAQEPKTEQLAVVEAPEKEVEEIKEPEVKEETEEEAKDEEAKEEEPAEPEEEISEEEYLKMLEDVCDNVDTQDVYPRPKKDGKYVPWKTYWHTDPIPAISEPNRPGPFRDTAMRVPMELRPLKMNESGVENAGSSFSPTRSGRGPRPNESNIFRMSVLSHAQPTPVPAPPTSSKQQPGVEFTRSLGEAQKIREEHAALRRDFRRRRIMFREDERVNKLLENERMTELMRDRHRERVLEHLERQQGRQNAEREAIYRVRDAKKQLAQERRELEVEKATAEVDRSLHRLDARRAAQIQRSEAEGRRRAEAEARALQERAAKDARSQVRWQQRLHEVEQSEHERLLRDHRLRSAKIVRRDHFRRLEEQGQAARELKATIFRDNQALYQSALSY